MAFCRYADARDVALASYETPQGWVAEWFKAAVLKTAVGLRSPWVRIPPHPPILRRPTSLRPTILFAHSA